MSSSAMYYKAIRPDGSSFHDPTFRWLPESGPIEGHTVRHASHEDKSVIGATSARSYLSVSVEPADCTGMRWPCRLLEVEPVDDYPVVTPEPFTLPYKRAARAWRVVRELPAHTALGPQGVHVAALIERASVLTEVEVERLDAAGAAAGAAAWATAWATAWGTAWDTARGAARAAAGATAWDTAWDAARDAARAAARGTAGALVTRDLISTEHYDTLTLPWRRIIGRLHPDDAEVTAR